MLASSSLTRVIISVQALVNPEKLASEVHMSLMIFIARFRTLTPVSFILSAIFSKYLKPTSGCEAICLPTSSNAASLTDIAESQNLPSTADCTRLSPNTSGSASTMMLTAFKALALITGEFSLKLARSV
ncbi:hypothetical protein V8G54_012308 [Vigna mungo]|uniref:Uncharacterized protein n=1 Tax=Vigna mungo TaxID=3915 RepID=A0AAQ3NTA4_VIGMU